MTDGKLVKMDVDYTDAVALQVPKSEEIAKSGNLSDALEPLLVLEKQCRQSGDAISAGKVLCAVIRLCANAKNYDKLIEEMVTMSKRRSQFKQAVTHMVQEAVKVVDEISSDRATQMKLIEAIRTVTEGKIYVEVERARITYKLALLLESEGKAKEAAEVLQDLQVETYGSMDRREKTDMLLEQMRLCLAKKDYVRTQIISRKISTRFFEDEANADLKLKYYKLMIELDEHDEKFLNVSRHYNAISSTNKIKENLPDALQALQCMVSYLILAPYDNEQADLLHRAQSEKNLEHIQAFKTVVKKVLTDELIQWKDFVTQYEQILRQGTKELPAVYVFQPNTESGKARWEHLRQRITEHNIRIIAKCYSKISLNRLAHLANLSTLEAEEYIGKLVTKKTIFARIDRPEGMIVFRPQKNVDAVLDGWAGNVAKLMEMINQTTHLINKEEMIHGMQHLVPVADRE